MEVKYLGSTLDDINFWKKSGNKQIRNRPFPFGLGNGDRA